MTPIIEVSGIHANSDKTKLPVYQGIETKTILPRAREVRDGNIAKIIHYFTEN